jgi:hypothetical protein
VALGEKEWVLWGAESAVEEMEWVLSGFYAATVSCAEIVVLALTDLFNLPLLLDLGVPLSLLPGALLTLLRGRGTMKPRIICKGTVTPCRSSLNEETPRSLNAPFSRMFACILSIFILLKPVYHC